MHVSRFILRLSNLLLIFLSRKRQPLYPTAGTGKESTHTAASSYVASLRACGVSYMKCQENAFFLTS